MSEQPSLRERVAEAISEAQSLTIAPRPEGMASAALAAVRAQVPDPPPPPSDCCANEAWRGQFCTYHEGFADGWAAAVAATLWPTDQDGATRD